MGVYGRKIYVSLPCTVCVMRCISVSVGFSINYHDAAFRVFSLKILWGTMTYFSKLHLKMIEITNISA